MSKTTVQKLLTGATAALFAALLTAATKPSVKVEDAWIRTPPPGARTTAAFFSLKNDGKTPLTIKEVKMADAVSAEIHATTQTDEGSSMAPVKDLTVAPGASATLVPGGMHVMVFGLGRSIAAGDTVPLVLTLDGGEQHGGRAGQQLLDGVHGVHVRLRHDTPTGKRRGASGSARR
jgi:copper(I)-binding protein